MFEITIAVQIMGILLSLYAISTLIRGDSTFSKKLMLLFLVSALVHNTGFLFEMFAKSEGEALIATKIEYLGASFVAYFYMLFINNYCRRKGNLYFEHALLIVDLLVVIAVWTSPLHSFFYKGIDFVDSGLFPHLELTYGLGFYVYFIFIIVTFI